MNTDCRSQEEDDSQGDTHPRKRIKLKARRGAATPSGAEKKDMEWSQTEDSSVQTLYEVSLQYIYFHIIHSSRIASITQTNVLHFCSKCLAREKRKEAMYALARFVLSCSPVAGGPDYLTLRRFDLWKEDHLCDCVLRCSGDCFCCVA